MGSRYSNAHTYGLLARFSSFIFLLSLYFEGDIGFSYHCLIQLNSRFHVRAGALDVSFLFRKIIY